MIKKEVLPKLTLRDRFYWWLYRKVNKTFYKNRMGVVSGWWQAGSLDKKAWEWLQEKYPPHKYWLTSEYYVKHYRRITTIKGLLYNVNNVEITKNKKGNRVATLDLELWQDEELMTLVKFTFVEKAVI